MNPQRDYIHGLVEAIRKTHGVEARHIGTVPVQEMFRGEVAWQGEVEVFQVDHSSGATRLYGWGYPSDDDPTRYQYVCVLGIGPVVSPRYAVVAAIRSADRGDPNPRIERDTLFEGRKILRPRSDVTFVAGEDVFRAIFPIQVSGQSPGFSGQQNPS